VNSFYDVIRDLAVRAYGAAPELLTEVLGHISDHERAHNAATTPAGPAYDPPDYPPPGPADPTAAPAAPAGTAPADATEVTAGYGQA
jgi:hypothetical protein